MWGVDRPAWAFFRPSIVGLKFIKSWWVQVQKRLRSSLFCTFSSKVMCSLKISIPIPGLLPWIDNYAHLFGFIFGFLVSYAIMPFVTFGIYERRRKLILLWICLLSCIFIFVGLILLFYVTPIHDCEICKYFNCIPITKDFCSEQNIDLRETVWPLMWNSSLSRLLVITIKIFSQIRLFLWKTKFRV